MRYFDANCNYAVRLYASNSNYALRRYAEGLYAVGVWAVVWVGMLLVSAGMLGAQVDPRGSVRTLATRHFRVHVHAGREAEGRRAAAIAETAWGALSKELVAPASPVDLVIADNVDFSNGYAQVFPTNRVVIYDVLPIDASELRFHDDWLRLVITHELTHIFHIDRARGLWRAGRVLFGRNPIFFPNGLLPSWVKEGIAVYYESKESGSGRVESTEMGVIVNGAARDHALAPVHRWSLSTSTYPGGQSAYAYGSTMMTMAARAGGDSSMRKFVETTAQFPIPFTLNRDARTAFGTSFDALFDRLRDSLYASVARADTAGDARWRAISPDGWDAAAPRWQSADSILWSAQNGRDVTGLFVADVRRPGHVQRIARRNALDVNAPFARDSVMFAQFEYRNPYEVRSDLYAGRGGGERRITTNARLVQPDARRDGAVVAVQLGAGSAHLVRVSRSGVITTLRDDQAWADPRWSPDGQRLAAIQLLPTGESRVMVLDTLGRTQQIVTGARAVFASPSFTPNGARLVWSSDRSGRMQLETAPVQMNGAAADTMRWRDERDDVRMASAVTTAVYAPSVSPDGKQVVALRRRAIGLVVSVAPFDTTGPVARNTWYPRENPVVSMRDSVVPAAGTFTGYQVAHQLWPRYWLPQIGTGRLGQSTYGLSSSGDDVLGRHEWSASVLVNGTNGETDAAAAYRYRGIGVPVLDVSWSQAWDATFTAVDSTRRVLGTIARRRRFTTMAATWSAPGYRHSVNGVLGVQFEQRDFTATVDSLLGPSNALLRRGTRYPGIFANTSFSTARRGARGISVEEGVVLTTSSSYRWRDDAPGITGSWRQSGTLRAYVPIPLPGFSRHALMLRAAGAVTDVHAQTEFSVGGVSGVSSELLPGFVIGDPGRTFPVRGVTPDVQRGNHALGGTVEYRAPLALLTHAPSPFTFFFDKLSLAVFSDAARAWCPSAQRAQTTVCLPRGVRDGWIASAGAELVVDLAAQYDVPYRLRVGAAAPYAAPVGVPTGGRWYVTLGSFF